MNSQIKEFSGQDKVWIGYLIGVIALVTLIVACIFIGDPDPAISKWSAVWVNVLLFLFGGLLGWGTGILASPLDRKDASLFAKICGVISTFLTGFVLAKADRFIDAALDKGTLTVSLLGPILIFLCAFILGALFTFVGRRYLGT